MPNFMSEFDKCKVQHRKTMTSSRKLVCKIYYKTIIEQLNKNEVLINHDCHNIFLNSENLKENNCVHVSMWSKFNKGIIYTTKGLRKAENEYINAVVTGKLEDVAKLLRSGVNPNVKDQEDLTALHIATERGDVNIAKCILSAKDVEVDATTSNGDTPLITAVRCNRENVVQLLLNHGANPNVTNNVGTTPLLIACSSGFVEIARNLLLFHANANCQDSFGDVPLVKAMIEHPNKIIVLLLLRYGANPNFRTMRKHPLFLELALHCRSKIHMEMVDIMIRSGVNLNIQSSISKYTALHIASIGGNTPLVKHLLEKGANTEKLDFIGRTPMDVAVEHGHLGLVRVYKNWKKQQEEIKIKESEAKKSALAHKDAKNKVLGKVLSHTSAARAVTFSDNDIESFQRDSVTSSNNDSNKNINLSPKRSLD